MQQNKEIINVFKRVYEMVRKHGFARIEAALNTSMDPARQETIDFVLFKTADAFQVTVDDIKKSTRRGAVTESRKMCFVLFKKHIEISQNEISRYFERDPMIIKRALENFKTLNTAVKVDKQFLEKFEVLEKEVIEFKEKLVAKYANKK